MTVIRLFSPPPRTLRSSGVGLGRARECKGGVGAAAGTLAVLLLVLAGTGFATQVVYDNGAPNLANGYEMTSYLQANEFTLSSGIVLSSVTFWDADGRANNFQNTVYWEIRTNSASNAPGSVLFSGTSTGVTHTSTGRKVEVLYPEFINTVALPPITLYAGNYWLVLHDGPITNTTQQYIYWETAANNGTAPSLADKAPFTGDWQTNSSPTDPLSQMAFQLQGVPQSLWPQNTSITRTGTSAPKISFSTASGQHYSVEYKNNLTDPSWTAVSGATNIPGTGGVVQVTDPDPNIANVRRRFYHVILL